MFSTDHLPLAAYLCATGFKHNTVRTVGTSRVVFNFDHEGVQSEVEAFHNGQAVINPVEFESCRISLRREIERLTKD